MPTPSCIVDGVSAQVVGVTPPSFFGLAVGESFDIVLPLCQPQQLMRNLFDVTVMGRLRPGVSLVTGDGSVKGDESRHHGGNGDYRL